MGGIALLGASGSTGHLVAAELGRRGHRFVAAGRDVAKVERRLDGIEGVEAVREVDVHDEAALSSLCRDADVLITTVGPFEEMGRPVLRAAVEHGAHYVDSTGELPFIRWAFEEWGAAAEARGVAAVPAAGYDFLPGDLLADLAGHAVVDPDEIHVTYAVLSTGGLLRGVTRGTRASIAGLLGRQGVARLDGRLEPELPGEARRLAWFSRPVGPTHAAGFPGAEPITVPRHVPGVSTVRTYFAMPGWQAELFQFGARLTRWDPARRLATALLRAGPEGSREAQQRTRWACVAESQGQDEVARAWAYGTDIYGLTAVTIVVVAEALQEGPRRTGVVAPAEVIDPDVALDEVADRCDLKWSVARPHEP